MLIECARLALVMQLLKSFNATCLILAPHHEAGDILQEDQRDFPLCTKLDEMRAFFGAFGKKHPVVGQNPNRAALDMPKARHKRLTKARFELIQPPPVEYTVKDGSPILRLAQVAWHNIEQVLCGPQWRLGLRKRDPRGQITVEMPHSLARQRQSMRIVIGQIVCHAGKPRVQIPAAQVFG